MFQICRLSHRFRSQLLSSDLRIPKLPAALESIFGIRSFASFKIYRTTWQSDLFSSVNLHWGHHHYQLVFTARLGDRITSLGFDFKPHIDSSLLLPRIRKEAAVPTQSARYLFSPTLNGREAQIKENYVELFEAKSFPRWWSAYSSMALASLHPNRQAPSFHFRNWFGINLQSHDHAYLVVRSMSTFKLRKEDQTFSIGKLCALHFPFSQPEAVQLLPRIIASC